MLKDAAFHLDQATKRGNKLRRTNVHFSGPNDEDEHQNLSSDDSQVIQQENVCSEPPEPLSYSLFQSHFQASSTSNTQKIFLPKPIWEKLSKDQQQMIIDHNRLTEVDTLQGIYPLKDEWVFGCSLKPRLADQTKTQQLKWLWSKDSMNSTINQRLVEQTQEINFKLEGSGDSTLGDTLRKQYLSSSDE